jgi:hypothetical protein
MHAMACTPWHAFRFVHRHAQSLTWFIGSSVNYWFMQKKSPSSTSLLTNNGKLGLRSSLEISGLFRISIYKYTPNHARVKAVANYNADMASAHSILTTVINNTISKQVCGYFCRYYLKSAHATAARAVHARPNRQCCNFCLNKSWRDKTRGISSLLTLGHHDVKNCSLSPWHSVTSCFLTPRPEPHRNLKNVLSIVCKVNVRISACV